MSSRFIESLLPISATPRAAEPGPRAAEGGRFGSALDEALQAEASDESRVLRDDRNAADPAAEGADEPLCDLPREETAGDRAAADDVGGDDVTGQAVADEGADESAEDDDATEYADAAAAEAAALAAAAAAPLVVIDVAEAVDGALASTVAASASPESTEQPAPGDLPATVPGESADATHADAEAADPSQAVQITPEETSADNSSTPDHRRGELADDASTTDSKQAPAESAAETAGKRPEGSAATDADLGEETASDADSTEFSAPVAPRHGAATPQAEAAVTTDGEAATVQPPTDAAPADSSPPAGAQPPAAAPSATSTARLAPGRTIHAATARGDADGAEQVDRSRFLGRVEGAIRTAQQRDGRVQVRLSPPELGSLRIELTVEQGVLSARLEAETPAARKLLLDNLPALRERLAQQDVRVDRFDVDVRRESGAAGGGPQDRPTGDSAPRHGDERREHAASRQATTIRPHVAPIARTSPESALDVRV